MSGAGLEQHLVRNADLPDVVDPSSLGELGDGHGRPARRFGKSTDEVGDPFGVLLVWMLLRVDRAGKGANRHQGLQALQAVGSVAVGELEHDLGRVQRRRRLGPGFFAAVERAVREPQQLLAAVGMGEVADSSRHRQVSGDADRSGAELRRPTFGDRQRLFCRRLREQQGELVAADPAEDVAGARAGFQESRGLHQRSVSRLVTVRVVDALEVIEVEKHERKRPSIALGTSNLTFDPLLERAMVQQTGQRVAGGLGQ